MDGEVGSAGNPKGVGGMLRKGVGEQGQMNVSAGPVRYHGAIGIELVDPDFFQGCRRRKSGRTNAKNWADLEFDSAQYPPRAVSIA